MSLSMRLTVVLIILAAATGGQVISAQVVRGSLVEYTTGNPLPGAAVVLVDSAGVVVDSTQSTAAARFTLRATAGGHHSLHFSHPGYASVPSAQIRLAVGDTVEHRFAVPLISVAAIQRMSEVIDLEKRLQTNLTELCGEQPRLWEAGILVGVVRRRAGGDPLPGAFVRVEASERTGSEPFRKATMTSANGVYLICNVPVGTMELRTELTGYRADEGPVEVRAGEVSWYDIELRAR